MIVPDSLFPERPALVPKEPARVVRIVRVEPLLSIHETLALSIHNVVNEPACQERVLDLYRIARRIEAESWLRRALDWKSRHGQRP